MHAARRASASRASGMRSAASFTDAACHYCVAAAPQSLLLEEVKHAFCHPLSHPACRCLCILLCAAAAAAQSLTLEEAKARADRLARMRHLLFYAELKAKRLAKIKSKEHARRANRAAKRAASRLADAAGDEVAAARAAAEEAEFDRAKVGWVVGVLCLRVFASHHCSMGSCDVLGVMGCVVGLLQKASTSCKVAGACSVPGCLRVCARTLLADLTAAGDSSRCTDPSPCCVA